jgi:hypothetical protein
MHPDFYQLIEVGLSLVVLLGLGYGVKLLFVDHWLARRLGDGGDRRLAEVEERCERMAEAMVQQEDLLEEYRDRLEFSERLLAHRRLQQLDTSHQPEVVTPA